MEDFFVDSNVLVNIVEGNESGIKSGDFLQEKRLFAITHILEESYYSLLIIKAKKTQKIEKKWEILEFLKKNQEFIHQESKSLLFPFVNIMGLIKILPVNNQIFLNSLAMMRKYALLPTDALIAATMDYYNLNKIVSYDSDFDRVEWIKRIAP